MTGDSISPSTLPAGDGRDWGPISLASLLNMAEHRPRGDLWPRLITFLIREKIEVQAWD